MVKPVQLTIKEKHIQLQRCQSIASLPKIAIKSLQSQKKSPKEHCLGWKNSMCHAPVEDPTITNICYSRPKNLDEVTAQDHAVTVLKRTLKSANVCYSNSSVNKRY